MASFVVTLGAYIFSILPRIIPHDLAKDMYILFFQIKIAGSVTCFFFFAKINQKLWNGLATHKPRYLRFPSEIKSFDANCFREIFGIQLFKKQVSKCSFISYYGPSFSGTLTGEECGFFLIILK